MKLSWVISGVGEVICTLRSDSLVEVIYGASCSLAQPVLELGEELFDGVRSGEYFRPRDCASAATANRPPVLIRYACRPD